MSVYNDPADPVVYEEKLAMKRGVGILLVCSGLLSCQEVRPAEKAAVVTGRDYTFCGFCGGWFVRVDSTMYRAEIPAPYAKENTPVWLRYELDQRPGFKEGRWLKLKSIRHR